MELTGNLLVTNVENYPRFFKNEDKKFLSEMNEETARILRNDKDFSVNFTSVEKKIAEFFNNPEFKKEWDALATEREETLKRLRAERERKNIGVSATQIDKMSVSARV